jgi:hypothetical protein
MLFFYILLINENVQMFPMFVDCLSKCTGLSLIGNRTVILI